MARLLVNWSVELLSTLTPPPAGKHVSASQQRHEYWHASPGGDLPPTILDFLGNPCSTIRFLPVSQPSPESSPLFDAHRDFRTDFPVGFPITAAVFRCVCALPALPCQLASASARTIISTCRSTRVNVIPQCMFHHPLHQVADLPHSTQRHAARIQRDRSSRLAKNLAACSHIWIGMIDIGLHSPNSALSECRGATSGTAGRACYCLSMPIQL